MMMGLRFPSHVLTMAVLLLSMEFATVQAQTLNDEFGLTLGLPINSPSSSVVTVDFIHSDAVTFDTIKAFSGGCMSAGGSEFLLDGSIGLTSSQFTPANAGARTSTVTLTVTSAITVLPSTIYTAPTASFCLYATVSAGGTQANIIEVPMTLTLTPDGTISELNVNGNVRTPESNQIADVQVNFLPLQATLCGGAPPTVTQGSQLSVCIVNDYKASFTIQTIDTFTFTASVGGATQLAVTGGSAVSPFSDYACPSVGLTQTCTLNTFLTAAFFDAIRAVPATSATITGSGSAIMIPTLRRQLQEQGIDTPTEGTIQLSFELSVPADTSDAITISWIAATFTTALGATAALMG
jgi:hypothetical protein